MSQVGGHSYARGDGLPAAGRSHANDPSIVAGDSRSAAHSLSTDREASAPEFSSLDKKLDGRRMSATAPVFQPLSAAAAASSSTTGYSTNAIDSLYGDSESPGGFPGGSANGYANGSNRRMSRRGSRGRIRGRRSSVLGLSSMDESPGAEGSPPHNNDGSMDVVASLGSGPSMSAPSTAWKDRGITRSLSSEAVTGSMMGSAWFSRSSQQQQQQQSQHGYSTASATGSASSAAPSPSIGSQYGHASHSLPSAELVPSGSTPNSRQSRIHSFSGALMSATTVSAPTTPSHRGRKSANAAMLSAMGLPIHSNSHSRSQAHLPGDMSSGGASGLGGSSGGSLISQRRKSSFGGGSLGLAASSLSGFEIPEGGTSAANASPSDEDLKCPIEVPSLPRARIALAPVYKPLPKRHLFGTAVESIDTDDAHDGPSPLTVQQIFLRIPQLRATEEQLSEVVDAMRTGRKIDLRDSRYSSWGLDAKTAAELKKLILYKTEPCRNFEDEGWCPYGPKCQYAHGRSELRAKVVHPLHKTMKCRNYYGGGCCLYGRRCCFIHNIRRNHDVARREAWARALDCVFRIHTERRFRRVPELAEHVHMGWPSTTFTVGGSSPVATTPSASHLGIPTPISGTASGAVSGDVSRSTSPILNLSTPAPSVPPSPASHIRRTSLGMIALSGNSSTVSSLASSPALLSMNSSGGKSNRRSSVQIPMSGSSSFGVQQPPQQQHLQQQMDEPYIEPQGEPDFNLYELGLLYCFYHPNPDFHNRIPNAQEAAWAAEEAYVGVLETMREEWMDEHPQVRDALLAAAEEASVSASATPSKAASVLYGSRRQSEGAISTLPTSASKSWNAGKRMSMSSVQLPSMSHGADCVTSEDDDPAPRIDHRSLLGKRFGAKDSVLSVRPHEGMDFGFLSLEDEQKEIGFAPTHRRARSAAHASLPSFLKEDDDLPSAWSSGLSPGRNVRSQDASTAGNSLSVVTSPTSVGGIWGPNPASAGWDAPARPSFQSPAAGAQPDGIMRKAFSANDLFSASLLPTLTSVGNSRAGSALPSPAEEGFMGWRSLTSRRTSVLPAVSEGSGSIIMGRVDEAIVMASAAGLSSSFDSAASSEDYAASILRRSGVDLGEAFNDADFDEEDSAETSKKTHRRKRAGKRQRQAKKLLEQQENGDDLPVEEREPQSEHSKDTIHSMEDPSLACPSPRTQDSHGDRHGDLPVVDVVHEQHITAVLHQDASDVLPSPSPSLSATPPTGRRTGPSGLEWQHESNVKGSAGGHDTTDSTQSHDDETAEESSRTEHDILSGLESEPSGEDLARHAGLSRPARSVPAPYHYHQHSIQQRMSSKPHGSSNSSPGLMNSLPQIATLWNTEATKSSLHSLGLSTPAETPSPLTVRGWDHSLSADGGASAWGQQQHQHPPGLNPGNQASMRSYASRAAGGSDGMGPSHQYLPMMGDVANEAQMEAGHQHDFHPNPFAAHGSSAVSQSSQQHQHQQHQQQHMQISQDYHYQQSEQAHFGQSPISLHQRYPLQSASAVAAGANRAVIQPGLAYGAFSASGMTGMGSARDDDDEEMGADDLELEEGAVAVAEAAMAGDASDSISDAQRRRRRRRSRGKRGSRGQREVHSGSMSLGGPFHASGGMGHPGFMHPSHLVDDDGEAEEMLHQRAGGMMYPNGVPMQGQFYPNQHQMPPLQQQQQQQHQQPMPPQSHSHYGFAHHGQHFGGIAPAPTPPPPSQTPQPMPIPQGHHYMMVHSQAHHQSPPALQHPQPQLAAMSVHGPYGRGMPRGATGKHAMTSMSDDGQLATSPLSVPSSGPSSPQPSSGFSGARSVFSAASNLITNSAPWNWFMGSNDRSMTSAGGQAPVPHHVHQGMYGAPISMGPKRM